MNSFPSTEVRSELLKAAEVALLKCLAVKPGETVLITADELLRTIGFPPVVKG